jgi:hypothetical protein
MTYAGQIFQNHFLRLDQLGLILQLSGIHVGSRVLVYEQSLGIVAASILERLAGEGACIFLHRGRMPQSIPCFHAMMFGDKVVFLCQNRFQKFFGN